MNRKRTLLQSVLVYGGALFLLAGILLPVLWMFITSITPGFELLSRPPHWIPHEITFHRYLSVFGIGDVSFRGGAVAAPAAAFLNAMKNSIIIAVGTTLLCLALAIPTVYAVLRLEFAGRRLLLPLLIVMQMLPAIAMVVPLFAMLRWVHLTDTLLGLVLTDSGIVISIMIWLLIGYIRTLPVELEEAALLDGAGPFRAYLSITVRLAVPGIVAAGTLAFLNSWNEFLYALIFTSTTAAKPMPVIVSEFSTRFGLDYGMMMTGGVLASIPPIIIAVFFQRYLVSGLSAGSIKG